MHPKTAEKFMRIAIEQAKKGIGKTGPNPVVGCAVVKSRKVISTGFHKEFGGPHAEVIALRAAGKRAKGASLFVTLEPCSYYGKTPPCTDAIIKAGIKEVFCGALDPNPLNNGKGITMLKSRGISVRCGLLKKQAEKLNPCFIKRMKNQRPFVALKLAQSIDGKIATRKNDSKWISSAKSRDLVQGLRRNHDAVMVGIDTLLSDDPLLSVRKSRTQPVKIIVDSRLKTPLCSKIFSKASSGKTIIATTSKASIARENALHKKGAEIIRSGFIRGKVNLELLMKKLVQKGISSILVEGGSAISASMLESGLVDKVYFFICPLIIGGRLSKSSIGGKGAAAIAGAIKLSNMKLKQTGKDFLMEADVYRNN